MKSCVFKKFRS